MAARWRFTIAFPPELASKLEAVIPPRQRNQFVAEAVKARLRDLEREALRADMEECARIMHDEIMQIEAEFAPLDAEVDRLLRMTLCTLYQTRAITKARAAEELGILTSSRMAEVDTGMRRALSLDD